MRGFWQGVKKIGRAYSAAQQGIELAGHTFAGVGNAALLLSEQFISPKEKEVMMVLLKEQKPFIYLADNGFSDYYKPSDALFDAVAKGSLHHVRLINKINIFLRERVTFPSFVYISIQTSQ